MVFVQSDPSQTDEDLTFFRKVRMPEKYGPSETGFSNVHYGDSGSPCWKEVERDDGSGKIVNAIIAVATKTLELTAAGVYTDDEWHKCRSAASKVREETVEWIMNMHEKD